MSPPFQGLKVPQHLLCRGTSSHVELSDPVGVVTVVTESPEGAGISSAGAKPRSLKDRHLPSALKGPDHESSTLDDTALSGLEGT
jgi:hypothetical protein